MSTETSIAQIEKHFEILKIAEDLYAKNPDWITYYRELLGVDGLVRQTFLTQNQLMEFEQSDAYREIHHLLMKLREKQFAKKSKEEQGKGKSQSVRPKNEEDGEEIQVITVRIPKSVHETLIEEAYQCRASVNQLCISKLIQFIDSEMVPSDKKARR
jgi:predicted HicB family RNase H-like nuclease